MINDFSNSDGDNNIAQTAVSDVVGKVKEEADIDANENYIPLICAMTCHAIAVFIGVKKKLGLPMLLTFTVGSGLAGAAIGRGFAKFVLKK